MRFGSDVALGFGRAPERLVREETTGEGAVGSGAVNVQRVGIRGVCEGLAAAGARGGVLVNNEHVERVSHS